MKHEGNLIVTKDNSEYASTVTSVGGYLYVRADGKLTAPLLRFDGEAYTEIASSKYVLFAGDKGHYRAGCQGPFTADEAIAHWNRKDERAVIFTAAINANEARKC